MTEMTDHRPPILRRRDAAQATLDAYTGRPFKLGYVDCVRVAAHHLRLLGHTVRLPPQGSYRTILGARRALAKRGYASNAEAVDATGLVRKAPAAMIVGDLAMMQDSHGLGGLVIALGNGRLLGFHEDLLPKGVLVLQPLGVPDIVWDGAPLEPAAP